MREVSCQKVSSLKLSKKYECSAEEQRRYTATEWRDMFANIGSRVDIVEQPNTIVDTGLVGKRVLSK